jgi:hypothetical protein
MTTPGWESRSGFFQQLAGNQSSDPSRVAAAIIQVFNAQAPPSGSRGTEASDAITFGGADRGFGVRCVVWSC